MPSPSDSLFVELAIAKGYLDRARADEAQAIQRATKDDGPGRRLLPDILVEEGWMTREQIDEVLSQIEDGAARTGRIEGYRLLAKIGQGGMGAVYKATRETTGETVALKILPTRLAQKSDFIERFLREARAAATVQSEHIVRTVDVGFSGGYYYFAMEFVEGESVDTTLSIDGAMPESRALRIVHQIALALGDAARAGLVHRDIKPGNILVRADGTAKLTDFGLARETADDSVTQVGLTLGTPNYMSPEQAKAVKSLDVRSDIYSLGVTFYHMVTGAVPFKGETSMLTMLKHLNEPPVAPITRRADLSRGTNDVILKMLTKNRDERYRDADQLIADLELVMKGKEPRFAESTEPKPEAETGPEAGAPDEMELFAREMRRQGRLRWLKIAAGVFLAILVGIMIYAFFFAPDRSGGRGRRPDDEKRAAADRLERTAQAALNEAKQFAKQNPTQYVAIAEHYAEVERKFPASRVAAEARQLRSDAGRRLDGAVQQALKSCETAAERLAKADKYGAAIDAYDAFPADLRTPEAIERIDLVHRRNLERRAWDRFAELCAQADLLIRSKKIAAARAVLEPAQDFGISGIAAEARRRLAAITEQELAADSETSRQAFDEYLAAMSRVRALVRKGQFDPALAELNQEFLRTKHGLFRDLFPANRRIINAAREVWSAVMAGLTTLEPGARLAGGTVMYTFVAYDPSTGRVELATAGGRTTRLTPGWLPPAALRQLAVSGGCAAPVKLAAFFLARGEYPPAALDIQAAQKQKAEPELLKACEEQLNLLRKGRDEVEAENLLAKAKEEAASAAGGPEQTTRSLWELVTTYGGTACCAAHRTEIEDMLTRTAAETITADTLFAVRPAARADGASELKYDFSDAAQAADWTSVWKGQAFGRWSILPAYGEMMADSGLAYFKVPLQGDWQLDLACLDVRTAAVRFAMSTPSASPRTAGCTFRWKRAGEDAISTIEKAGKALGPEKRLAQFRVVGALRFSFELKAGTFTARLGDQLLHRASVAPLPADPGYIVLDEFNPGARITDAAIRTKLNKDWLEQNIAQPLRKERIEQARWSMAQYTPLLVGNDASAWRLYAASDAGRADWTFSQGCAVAPEKATCTMTTGDANWSDYAFTAKVRFGASPGAVRLFVRWADAAGGGEGYFAELAAARTAPASAATLSLGKVAGGRDETLKQASVDLAGLDSCPIFVEAHGKLIRVLLGRQLLAAEDDTFSTGRVGLASFRSGAQFFDVKIKLMK